MWQKQEIHCREPHGTRTQHHIVLILGSSDMATAAVCCCPLRVQRGLQNAVASAARIDAEHY